MRFPTDPIRLFKLQTLAIIVGGLCVITGVIVFSRPSSDTSQPRQADRAVQPEISPDRSTGDDLDATPVDESVFLATLWNPTPPPPPPDPPERQRSRPRPTPPQLELIAITWDGESHIAAVFVPSANKLRSLQLGDEVDGFEVTLIDERSIAISRGSVEHRLALVAMGDPS